MTEVSKPARRLCWEYSFDLWGWTVTAMFAPLCLSAGIFWEIAPYSCSISVPFVSLSIEQIEYDSSKECWQWCWSLARLIIWKTEFRLDLDLNYWEIGLNCVQFDDFSIHLGPFNVQIETGKFFALDDADDPPTLRLWFPKGHVIRTWPKKCDRIA